MIRSPHLIRQTDHTPEEFAKKAEWLGKCAALERGAEAIRTLALADHYRRQAHAQSGRASA